MLNLNLPLLPFADQLKKKLNPGRFSDSALKKLVGERNLHEDYFYVLGVKTDWDFITELCDLLVAYSNARLGLSGIGRNGGGSCEVADVVCRLEERSLLDRGHAALLRTIGAIDDQFRSDLQLLDASISDLFGRKPDLKDSFHNAVEEILWNDVEGLALNRPKFVILALIPSILSEIDIRIKNARPEMADARSKIGAAAARLMVQGLESFDPKPNPRDSYIELINSDEGRNKHSTLPERISLSSQWRKQVKVCLARMLGDDWHTWSDLSFPYQDQLMAILKESEKIASGSALNMHFLSNFAEQLSHLETAAIINTNHMWHRKAVDILIEVLFTAEAGEDFCSESFLESKLSLFRKVAGDRSRAFECNSPMLDTAISELDKELKSTARTKHGRLSRGPFEKKLDAALELGSDRDKLALGARTDFKVRSMHLHFSSYAALTEKIDPFIAVEQCNWTYYALSRIASGVAQLVDCQDRKEIRALERLQEGEIIPEQLRALLAREFSLGQNVIVTVVGGTRRGRVVEVRCTRMGFQKLKVSFEDRAEAESEWHAALDVKVDEHHSEASNSIDA